MAGRAGADHTFRITLFADSNVQQCLRRGGLPELERRLSQLDSTPAAIAVQINGASAGTRGATSETGVRALVVDHPDPDLILQHGTKPHFLISDMPGQYLASWLVQHFPAWAFGPVQKGLAEYFDGEQNVDQLESMVPLPGSYDVLGVPFLTRIAVFRSAPPITPGGLPGAVPFLDETMLPASRVGLAGFAMGGACASPSKRAGAHPARG